MNPMRGRRGAWLRQPHPDTMEDSYAAIVDTLRHEMNGDLFCPKVADGMLWQGQLRNDDGSSTKGITGFDHLQQVTDYCHGFEISVVPVAVPRGADPVSEANFHGAVAKAAGSLMIDLEPYAGFWDKGPLTGIDTYCATLRQVAPDAYLVIQPDPRQYGWNDARVAQVLRNFNALCPQDYVGADFASWYDVGAQVRNVLARVAAYPDIDHYLTLYGTDQTQLAIQLWNSVRDVRKHDGTYAILGFHCFALGAMNLDNLHTFRDALPPLVARDELHVAPAPEPAPKPEPIPTPEPTWVKELSQWQLDDIQAVKAASAAMIEAAQVRAELRLQRLHELYTGAASQ